MPLTQNDVDALALLLGSADTEPSGGVNRGGFYLAYYDLIKKDELAAIAAGDPGRLAADEASAQQVMLQAEITTYSGFIGGAALIGNSIAKFANPALYPASLDSFSYDIAAGLLQAIRLDVNQPTAAPAGILDQTTIQKTDQAVWREKGLGDYFPGNFQLWKQDASNLVTAGTLSSVIAGLQITLGAQVGFTEQDAIAKGGTVDDSNSDHTVVRGASGQVLFVADKTGLIDTLTGGLSHPVPALTANALEALTISLALFALGGVTIGPAASAGVATGIGVILGSVASGLLGNNDAASHAVGEALRLLYENIGTDIGVDEDIRDSLQNTTAIRRKLTRMPRYSQAFIHSSIDVGSRAALRSRPPRLRPGAVCGKVGRVRRHGNSRQGGPAAFDQDTPSALRPGVRLTSSAEAVVRSSGRAPPRASLYAFRCSAALEAWQRFTPTSVRIDDFHVHTG